MYAHTQYYPHSVVSRYLQFQMALCHLWALDLHVNQPLNIIAIDYVAWFH